MNRYFSCAEVREATGCSPWIVHVEIGCGHGRGRHFIPTPLVGGAWGFREVRARRYWAWIFLRGGDSLRPLIPGDIRRCLELRRPALIIQQSLHA